MNNTFAHKQAIGQSGGNPVPQPILADSTSVGGVSSITGRSYVTGKPSAMASFQDRDIGTSGREIGRSVDEQAIAVEDDFEYGMPQTEDANDLIFANGNKLSSDQKDSRAMSIKSGVFGGFNQSGPSSKNPSFQTPETF